MKYSPRRISLIAHVLCILIFQNLFAFTTTWLSGIGSNCYDDVCSFCVAGSQNQLILTGRYSFQPWGSSLQCDSASGLLLCKVDQNGMQLWQRHYGGTDAGGSAIVPDSTGNFYVTGWFTYQAVFGRETIETNTMYANSNGFLLKCNANGDILWARKQGSGYSVNGSGPAISANKNVFITCRTYGSLYLDEYEIAPPDSGSNSQIIEYSPDGVLLRNKALPFDADQIQFCNSKIYCYGLLTKRALLDKYYDVPATASRLFIAVIDTATLTPTPIFWATTGNDNTYITALLVTDDRNVYAAGCFFDTLKIDNYGNLHSSTGDNRFFVRLDQNSTIKWVYMPDSCSVQGGPGYYVQGFTKGIALDKAGNVFFSGTYNGRLAFGATTLSQNVGTSNFTDLFIAGFNSAGQPMTAISMGGPGQDACTNILIENDNSICIGGSFTDTITLGNKQHASYGNRDGFIANVATPLAAAPYSYNKPGMNKAGLQFVVKNRNLHIKANGEPALGHISIANLAGKTVFSTYINSGVFFKSMTQYPAGIYVVRIHNAYDNTFKFLLQ